MHACCATAPCEGALRDASALHSGLAAAIFLLASGLLTLAIEAVSCFTPYTPESIVETFITHLSHFTLSAACSKFWANPPRANFAAALSHSSEPGARDAADAH